MGRRQWLAAVAAGLVVVACGPVRPRARQGSGSARGTSQAKGAGAFPIVIHGLSAQDLASFRQFSAGRFLPLASWSPGGRGAPAPWAIVGALPFQVPPAGEFNAIDPGLREVNLQPSLLLPGALGAFASADGSHYAVPTFARPWGVQYDPSVFHDAGLAQPAPEWTIDDFETCCEVIAAAKARGSLPRLGSVLPPLLGTTWRVVKAPPAVQGMQATRVPQWGQFIDPALWGAFVLGFGGTVVRKGRFDLTDAGAKAGLQRMAALATRFGPPIGAIASGAPALSFAPTADAVDPTVTRVSGTMRWARFPVLPVRPLVPAGAGGLAVLPASQGLSTLLGPHGRPPAPTDALAALAEYAMWCYQHDRTTSGLAGLAPPVLADAGVQQAYWQNSSRPAGFAAVGDWTHFTVVGAGWPTVPNAGGQQTWSAGESPSPVYTALTQAAQERAPISGLLAVVTQQLNARIPVGNGA